MKSSRADTRVALHKIPEIEYVDDGRLTSYSGLVLFQALFKQLSLRSRLRKCFAHLGSHKIYGPDSVVLVLVVHILLGFRRLRGLEYYRDDPMVLRVCGLREMPSLSTLSRSLRSMDDRAVHGLRRIVRQLVMDRANASGLKRLTLDFDGSV